MAYKDIQTPPVSAAMQWLLRRRIVVSVGVILLVVIIPFAYLHLQVVRSLVAYVKRADVSSSSATMATGARAIPSSFSTNNQSSLLRPFPRWGSKGIDFRTLVDFVHGAMNLTASTVSLPKQRSRFPETLYVVDHKGVWVSQSIRQRTWNLMRLARVEPTERFFRLAWNVLQQEQDPQSWSSLRRALSADGFPFLAFYGDYKSCNHLNWKKGRQQQYSIPLFTTCAPVSCKYAFPMPSYQIIKDAQGSPTDWDTIMKKDYDINYPWSSKIAKVVWRGSLSAPNVHWNSTRWRVCVLAHSSHATSQLEGHVDVGLVSIPSINSHLKDRINWTAIGGGLQPAIHPMSDFQRYVAILDMDGNSWSSRFGQLLCYNSVIIKVQPDYVDYYHFKGDLQPWIHYVPVKGDLSDFVEHVLYVTDPINQNHMQQIISNANQWCRHHLTLESLARDMLDIWDTYVSYLDAGENDWAQLWAKERISFFSTTGFDMVPL